MKINAEKHIGKARLIASDFVRRFGPAYGEADDLSQIALSELVFRSEKFDAARGSESAFVGVVLRTALRKHREAMRSDMRRVSLRTVELKDDRSTCRTTSPDHDVLEGELWDMVTSALDARELQAVSLIGIAKLGYAEASERMGVKKSTMRSCLDRGREKVRRAASVAGWEVAA